MIVMKRDGREDQYTAIMFMSQRKSMLLIN